MLLLLKSDSHRWVCYLVRFTNLLTLSDENFRQGVKELKRTLVLVNRDSRSTIKVLRGEYVQLFPFLVNARFVRLQYNISDNKDCCSLTTVLILIKM